MPERSSSEDEAELLRQILADDQRPVEELEAYVALLRRKRGRFRAAHLDMPSGWLRPDLPIPSDVPVRALSDLKHYRERETRIAKLEKTIELKHQSEKDAQSRPGGGSMGAASEHPATIPNSTGQRRKRGPKPDYETASRVAAIVARVVPVGDWHLKLSEVGEALDHGVCNASDPKACDASDHEKIPLPRGWKQKGNDWLNPPDNATMVKDIEYRLRTARKKPITETLS
jgi:hypothetical protein